MIQYKNLYIVPSYHGRINFSLEVRDIFTNIKPDAVAVEMPENIKLNVINGVKRLPKLSLVVYYDELLDEHLYVPIDPCDSIIEGLRLAMEHNVSSYFIDLNVKAYQPEYYALPDDYAIRQMGFDNFYDVVKQLPRSSFNLDSEEFTGFLRNVFEETSIINGKFNDQHFIEEKIVKEIEDIDEQTKTLDQAREYYMAANLQNLMEEHEKILVVIGFAHWERIKTLLESGKLKTSILEYSPSMESELLNVPPNDIALQLCFTEIPYIAYQYEKFRSLHYRLTPGSPYLFDLLENIPKIFLRAEREYEKRYEEKLSLQKLFQLKQYLRNLVMIDSRMTPSIYHLVIASKNILDDDYAWYTYKTAMYYPKAVEEDDDIDTLDIEGNRIRFQGKLVNFRRRIPVTGKMQRFKIRKVEEPKKGDDWKEEWDKTKNSQCSFPEEDIILEEHYRYIRNTGHRILTEKYSKVHKFEGSILDGIDIRETIRNWVNGQHIYVKEVKKIQGDITSIIMIFDDEPLPPDYQPKSTYYEEKYPHNISFYAEHENESDLAFFATSPGENLVGPGISIIKLGGYISEFPPISFNQGYFEIFDPAANFYFEHCSMKSERLLLGAIYWSKGKYILYVDKRKPRNFLYRMAAMNNKNIVFVPITAFSANTINRLKYMHVLAGRFRRKYAHKYIDLNRKFKF